ncbi:MAG: hypothetical protein COV45_07825 [Deltaproteobacteria bacterium CG11_big_fil_rev_8_21_14_0_20_47_16]|nr:MAG: hypothetical protein COV45_07825 [Deltaproteobacteria bacterium CG11_big_fil_rev_8_21_14_0_20_47_16]
MRSQFKTYTCLLATLVTLLLSPTRLHAGPLPPLINFQSVLFDEGGNLLPSGPATIQFQILDEQQNPIYFESQTVDVNRGAVSALIGNGSGNNGTPTGGLPEEVFASGAPRYLQVQVGNQPPETPMTIVPVPYAQWSQTCATVAKGAVGFESLAPDVVAQLDKNQANTIGVTAKFINSGSSSVQGVLQDLDLSIKKRLEETNYLMSGLKQEAQDRSALDGKITAIASAAVGAPKISPSAIDWSKPLTSDVNMGGHQLKNLGAPTSDTDASTKKYVDSGIASVKAQYDLALAAAAAQLAAAKVGTTKIATGTYTANALNGFSPQDISTTGIRPRIVYIFSLTPDKTQNHWTVAFDQNIDGDDSAGMEKTPNGPLTSFTSSKLITFSDNQFTVSGSWNDLATGTYWFIALGEGL